MKSFESHGVGRRAKPLLGVRRQPGRLALAVFRLPLPLYRRGWGWLLGHTFLLVVHAGRKTGRVYSAVAMVLQHDPYSHEAVICSAWGRNADWIRNIRVRPALQVRSDGSRSHRSSASPRKTRASLLRPVSDAGIRGGCAWSRGSLGWDDLRSDAALRECVGSRPFVSFRPADPSEL
jgi:deazaflavin-dependent oxidoreductase (nitroreductase family)